MMASRTLLALPTAGQDGEPSGAHIIQYRQGLQRPFVTGWVTMREWKERRMPEVPYHHATVQSALSRIRRDARKTVLDEIGAGLLDEIALVAETLKVAS